MGGQFVRQQFRRSRPLDGYAGRIDDHYAIGIQRKEATSTDLVQAIDELLAGTRFVIPSYDSRRTKLTLS